MSKDAIILNNKNVERHVLSLRGQNVILGHDVADLYGIETREIVQAVKNNPDKFPTGYVFDITKSEQAEVIKNFDNPRVKFSPSMPKAFTEKGLYMLATILKSPQAVATTIEIIETFSKIRELTRSVSELSAQPEKEKQNSLMQKSGEILSELLESGLPVSDTETCLEINLAVMKFKHTIKRKKK
jgi:hypothetical protein